jgi:tRNA modification GTPase
VIPSPTIAAISTPPGLGGIAVLRVSGADAEKIALQLINVGGANSELEHRRAMVTQIRVVGEIVDDVVLTFFRAPNSYTGEDVVEISCHGGRYAANRILGLIIEKGARHARPGEFTERAFLNGKLDLAQAEAVAGMIHARTDRAGMAAARQLQGGLSDKVRQMRSKLLDLLALLELELDFSDEDVEFQTIQSREQTLLGLTEELDGLISTFRQGRLVREGLRVSLVGAPNAGKSTLLNAILQEDRAIVSEQPGTTRDVVEAHVELAGIEVILQDTAGLRKSEHAIESAGIVRTRRSIERADLVLLLVDEHEPLWPDDEILKMLNRKNVVLVRNKVDLRKKGAKQTIKTPKIEKIAEIELSALTHQGIDRLNSAIIRQISSEAIGSSDIIVSEARHHEALQQAQHSIQRASAQLRKPTLMASDLRDAVNHLGEITGETVGEEILDRIFSKFCIGK